MPRFTASACGDLELFVVNMSRLRLWVTLIIGLAALALDRVPPGQAPYVRPTFARWMRGERAHLLRLAHRYNPADVSGIGDREFAVVLATVLYNEHFGWFEETLPPVQPFTPLYQQAQVEANLVFGTDFSVWPANLRPSVAREILRGELPLPGQIGSVPVQVPGAQGYTNASNSVLTAAIAVPSQAAEYLAANLARGVYRARAERVAVNWQTLAAWHNAGIVTPRAIASNPAATDYLQRAARYQPLAEAFVDEGLAELHAVLYREARVVQ